MNVDASIITKENCVAHLLEVRRRSGVSREELAALLGVDRTTVRRIELGATPSWDFMNRLKAVQLIGFTKLADAEPTERDFVAQQICAQPGRGKSLNAAEFFKSSMTQLTPAGVIAGLS